MKKIILLLSFFLVNTFAFAQGFVVKNFTADIYLNSEGYFDVVENYDVEFNQAQHGIYREIITDYKFQTAEGKTEKRNLVIENIEVPSNKFEVSSKREQRMDGKVVIKIGEKDKVVSGLQHYEIKYRVYNAFLFEDDSVQFYWNIKPEGWLAVFLEININIHTPDGTLLSPENCFLYAGDTGVTTPSKDFDYSYSNGVFSAQSHEYTYSIPGQDVTALVKMPLGSIKENFITVPLWQQYGWIGILLFLLFLFWLVWMKYGKDDKVISTTSYYPPKGIDPAMAGYLINDRDDSSDLIAFLPHWASQGFITIEEIPKHGLFSSADMRLTKLKDLPENVPQYEQKFFNGLFGGFGFIFESYKNRKTSDKQWVEEITNAIRKQNTGLTELVNTVQISSLSNSFYVTMNEAREILKDKAQIYYEAKVEKIIKITILVSFIIGVILFLVFMYIYGPLAAIVSAITCVFIGLMSYYLQKKNKLGNAVLSELKGFKKFIEVAEENKLKMLLQDDPHYFENTMSYALAFGLLEK